MSENSPTESLTVDQICSQMRQYRREFDADVGQLVANTQSLTDWRRYVTSNPLLAFGVCAAAGYLLMPGKTKYTSPDPDQIAKLVSRDRLVVAPPQQVKSSGGIFSGVLGTVTRIGLQTASGIVMQKLGAALESSSDQNQSS